MNKLKLDLSNLEVESFSTAQTKNSAGTVRGHSDGIALCDPNQGTYMAGECDTHYSVFYGASCQAPCSFMYCDRATDDTYCEGCASHLCQSQNNLCTGSGW
ncbi:MAG TPA: hypothetical protein VFJ16_31280 [Longimicrobium sp.]|nr:hypothetical protein [Longimicrobium sp.]